VRVRIDDDRCLGHAVCASLAPHVFVIPAEGDGALVAMPIVDPDLEPPVRRAVAGCPEQAIVLEES
jgi:ferredoxin